MQAQRGKAEALGRKAKLANSYQELLDEFASKELKSVGNYTLGKLVGKGSFGKVYLATHKLTNGSKVVLKSANKDDSNLAREIHHHRQFIHPHIARLYEVIVTETLVWLVLEYCPGAELYNYLLENGPLPVFKVQKIFAQLVGAVCYVHAQSCVHRDLKLENILFDKNENVKLVDFGFTREYEGKANYLQTFCGTICYSAPEMLKGERYAGEKVDVWSLGVILYALLCGELPFDDDDDDVTRRKILSDEPRYPSHLTEDARSLIQALLSKRTLIRPSLPDILSHPFLAEHAPVQQAILRIQPPSPFSAGLEKETLMRMRSAGVNIDHVIESVLAQRCDALAGWWVLLLEKEEKKVRRRERKRREKEAELKSVRRLSAASSRLDRLSFVGGGAIGGEDSYGKLPTPRARGRPERRSSYYADLSVMDLPQLPESRREPRPAPAPADDVPPPPIDKDSIRSASRSSRHRRPVPPPKEPGVLRSARSRGSTLHLVTTSEVLENGRPARLETPRTPQHPQHRQSPSSPLPLLPPTPAPPSDEPRRKVRKKPSQAIIAHWRSWTHWFYENTRRHKGQGRRGSHSTPSLVEKNGGGSTSGKSKDKSPRPNTGKHYHHPSEGASPSQASAPSRLAPNGHTVDKILAAAPASGGGTVSSGSAAAAATATAGSRASAPRISTNIGSGSGSGSGSRKRQSLSPSPLTPRSTMRRASNGLRGRKSTSSSVSSIRSIHHHHHSNSKASSTSSTNSVSTSMSKTPVQRGHSPHHSVKVLPATPQGSATLPSNLRLVRGKPAPLNLFGGGGGSSGGGGGGGSGGGRGIVTGSGSSGGPSVGGIAAGTDTGGGAKSLAPGFWYNEVSPPLGSPNPFASGVLFAKRKRSVFKGPMLGFGTKSSGAGSSSSSHSRSTSGGALGRRSGEIAIMEEEEDEDFEEAVVAAISMVGAGIGADGAEDDDVEEVDNFSPIIGGPGETVEIFTEDDGDADTVRLARTATGGSSSDDVAVMD